MADYSNNKQSQFNAGVALAERIDILQKEINAARFNPLQVHPETMTFGYEIMISSNQALFNEAWAKLNPEERKEGAELIKIINNFLSVFPPLKINKGIKIINIENYKNLLNLIDLLEKKNKEYLDAHSLNSPNKEEEGDDYDY